MIKSLDRRGTWRTYSVDSGLAGLRIEHIAEDCEGYLWFATWDHGVSRFDGDEFQNFTERDGLCSDRTFFSQKDSRDRIWFGTLNGVCWYDGANFHHLEDDGIAGRAVQFIYEDNEGRIWCGGTGTLGYYDGAAFHDLIPIYLQYYEEPPSPQAPKRCRGIAQDPQGHLWFGFDYLIRFDGHSFHRYEKEEGFPQRQMSYAVGCDHTGKVWFGQRGHQNDLWCYADGYFQPVQVELGGALRRIQSDGTGRMWFSTSKGVLYQDSTGFSRFTIADGLPHPSVKAVFQDREHQYWFATWGGIGVYDDSISVFDLSAEFPSAKSQISQLLQDRRGDIWIGYASPNINRMSESLFRFDGEHFALVCTEDGVDIDNCFAIYEDLEGYLWFGGGKGLFRYEDQKLKKMDIITAGLERKSVSAIAQDREGQFLFGHWENSITTTRKDLFDCPLKIIYRREEHLQTIFVKNEVKDPFSRIGTVITGRNGEFYFYLSHQTDKGFARWHPKDGLKFYGIEDGLIDQRVTDLLLDRSGNLWIATQGGLSRFDGKSFHTFTTEDGLLSQYIRCLFEDRQGHLWIGTDSGVVHYDGQLFQTIKSPHIGPVCQILEDRDGTFWFGTILGSLIRYRMRQFPPQTRPLRVIAKRAYENPTEVVLTSSDHPVIFEYKGMSFSTHPRDMLYVYRLKGYDTDWQPATRDMSVRYRNLPQGDYTFQVRAIDRDLNYSEIAEVQISVESDLHVEGLIVALNSQESNEFIGQSKALHQFQFRLKKVASTDMTVMIMGETGVGKGLAARVLHALSPYRDGPFIQVNCGALPESLIDSELFGHEKGAFTNAVSRRLGKVERAKNGTLFLDEIGDMTLEMQIKLLRLLDEGAFERIGGNRTLKAQTRIVAATNRNLKEMVSTGDFREDLYYRLLAFPIYLPPLRERKEDIPDLAEFFKNRTAMHLGKQIDPLTPEVIEVLQSYDWPGNVREVEHTINRALILCPDSHIEIEDLELHDSRIEGTSGEDKRETLPASQEDEIMPLNELERHYILKVLNTTNWRIKGTRGAAALLGLPPSTLYTKMKKLGIKRL